MTVRERWPQLILVGMACVLTACPAHVTLDVPPPDSPFAVREAAYQRLRPTLYRETLPWNGPRRLEFLKLADGSEVYYVEDILRAVPADCETAHAVRETMRLERTRTWLGVSAVASFAAGLTLAGLSISKDHPPSGPFLWSGVAVAGAGVGLAFGAGATQSRAMNAAEGAFESYDGCLQRRLSVCVEPACDKGSLREAK